MVSSNNNKINQNKAKRWLSVADWFYNGKGNNNDHNYTRHWKWLEIVELMILESAILSWLFEWHTKDPLKGYHRHCSSVSVQVDILITLSKFSLWFCSTLQFYDFFYLFCLLENDLTSKNSNLCSEKSVLSSRALL